MKASRAPASLPVRARDAHKGDLGTVLVVAGSRTMLGAAILCARGALRAGAGLVRAALARELCVPFMVAVPCATTVWRGSRAFGEQLRRADAIALGPGLGQDARTRALVREVVRAARASIVLDADALNALAPLRRPLVTHARAVLTPHPGEAARLLGAAVGRSPRARRDAVLELARRSGQIVVLKGAGTLVCDGARIWRNTTGNPGMATGGSGDVLTGVIAALLAQGMSPFEAACLAVRAHGIAGDRVAARLSQAGLTAEDLPLAIAEVLRR